MSEPIYETPERDGDSAPIFKGFTPLPPGTYTIWSQRYAGTVVDLYDSQPRGKIQGFPSHTGNNQKWILTPQGEPTLVTWKPVQIDSYAYTGGNIAGNPLIGNYPVSSTWEITMKSPNTGTIGIPGTNLLWTLTSGQPETQIVLQAANNDANQIWNFQNIG
ncbi:hypothetical protein B0H13DRAFT_2331266 [Mycena leptocephala]|nr:hypothetical protein B0H13DRAFT_2331266 [Mycena leptocephala]